MLVDVSFYLLIGLEVLHVYMDGVRRNYKAPNGLVALICKV